MTRRQKLMLSVIGGSAGLVFGLVYWFAWGCRTCARNSHPALVVLGSVMLGVALALHWGPDHLRRETD